MEHLTDLPILYMWDECSIHGNHSAQEHTAETLQFLHLKIEID